MTELFDYTVLQNPCGKMQDFIKVGTFIYNKDNSTFNQKIGHYIILADGHGTNTFIDIIRDINFDYFIHKDDTLELLINYFKNMPYIREPSGCTFILIKIFEDNIECQSIGDSQFVIFIDKKCIYVSNPHTIKNLDEKERLRHRYIAIEQDMIPSIFSDTILKPKIKYYHSFENGVKLALTQALGHNGITGVNPEKVSIPYLQTQNVRVVAFSDGYGDMHNFEGPYVEQDMNDLMTLNSNDLVKKAYNRWVQTWDCYYEGYNKSEIIEQINYMVDDVDDISLVVWDNIKIDK